MKKTKRGQKGFPNGKLYLNSAVLHSDLSVKQESEYLKPAGLL